jgi:hypothetical protein
LWRKELKDEVVRGDDWAYAPDNWAFAPHNRQLVLCSIRGLSTIDCETAEQAPAPIPSALRGVSGRTLVRVDSGRLLCASFSRRATRDDSGVRMSDSACVFDAVTGEVLRQFEIPMHAVPKRPVLSPDGMHLAMIEAGTGAAEIWNMETNERICASAGTVIEFSPQGDRAAIAASETALRPGQSNSRTTGLRWVSVWDLRAKRRLCEISLAGNRADELRFSPDGQRLLTLHGKIAMGTGGSAAQGRLWDISSGREILAIPVADVNHYIWDLVFDAQGERLTSLLFGRSMGSGGGGKSVSYEATPLDEEQDSALIAGRIVEKLSLETPLPGEIVTAIESRGGLKPRVRDAAIALAKAMPPDEERIAQFCLNLLAENQLTEKEYARAESWLKVLQERQKYSLRTQAIEGGLKYRKRDFAGAIAALQSPAAPPARDPVNGDEYELLRRAFYILSLQDSNEPRKARSCALELQFYMTKNNALRSGARIPWNVVFQAMTWAPNRTRVPDFDSMLRTATTAETMTIIEMLDTDGSGFLSSADGGALPVFWVDLQPADADKNSQITFEEVRRLAEQAQKVQRLMQMPAKDRLAGLNDVIAAMPDYFVALNARARTLATDPQGDVRNGAQAVADAKRACELSDWERPAYLDTLAAALAATGKFAEAIVRQEEAIAKANLSEKIDFASRLELYRQGKPYREQAGRSSSGDLRLVQKIDGPPLLSAKAVNQARRIPGWCSCCSPVGKKIVRNLSYKAEGADTNLEIVDLETGAATTICLGGVDPAWSPIPDGPIAFVRGPEGQKRNAGNEEIWLADPSGANPLKFIGGGFPAWSSDGRLFYRTFEAGDFSFSRCCCRGRKNAPSRFPPRYSLPFRPTGR